MNFHKLWFIGQRGFCSLALHFRVLELGLSLYLMQDGIRFQVTLLVVTFSIGKKYKIKK